MFVLKLTADGDHVWSRSFGKQDYDYAFDLAIRGDAIAIVGAYRSWAPGENLSPMYGTNTYFDAYIVTMKTDGAFAWNRTLNGLDRSHARGVALDNSGNVVVVGDFGGTVDFGGSWLTAIGVDAFAAKYAGPTGVRLFPSGMVERACNRRSLCPSIQAITSSLLVVSMARWTWAARLH